MTSVTLSRHDVNVLEKIKDPEANPDAGIVVDATLPRDPQIADSSEYARLTQKEREILLSIQEVELQLAGLRSRTEAAPVETFATLVSMLDGLVSEHPRYASARNNRVQALRRLYGDAVLLSEDLIPNIALLPTAPPSEKRKAAVTVLNDLDVCINLLSPATPSSAISPQAARTLSMAHTQRAAIYHTTAKALGSSASLSIDTSRVEAGWTKMDFEEAASREFALGGRYGNEIAKGLAVSTNPTAKLCGEMVREAMRKEYGPSFGD